MWPRDALFATAKWNGAARTADGKLALSASGAESPSEMLPRDGLLAAAKLVCMTSVADSNRPAAAQKEETAPPQPDWSI
jgi:hypothetical protein